MHLHILGSPCPSPHRARVMTYIIADGSTDLCHHLLKFDSDKCGGGNNGDGNYIWGWNENDGSWHDDNEISRNKWSATQQQQSQFHNANNATAVGLRGLYNKTAWK